MPDIEDRLPLTATEEELRAYAVKRGFISFDAKAVNIEDGAQDKALGIRSAAFDHPRYDRKDLPSDAATRKAIPIATGVLDYFPLALAEVAVVSRVGNDQHNPGQPLHWDKTKSMDHADSLVRHLLERGGFDSDGVRHSAKAAWRALALLEIELEAE